jgi:hypothetical protein
MSNEMRGSTIRELNEWELDAISGGRVYDGAMATANVIKECMYWGAAIMFSQVDSLLTPR